MIKKSASRYQRSKGVKVKHVLQILLLICICIWLLYQIKCSYDRSREMTKKGSKTPVKGEDDSGGDLKLGRKDLREKQGEEADEESKDEDEGNQGEREDVEVDEDEIRRDVARMEEQERQEGKKGEGNDEGADNREDDNGRDEEEGNNDKMDEVDVERGGDEAGVNEAEVEGGEAEIDREEDFVDEDKGGREKRIEDEGEEDNSGDKEEQVEGDDLPEDRDPNEVNENMLVAHEVHYQADDASDAVAFDTHEDDENANEEDSNDTGVSNRLTESKQVNVNEEESEAIAGDKGEANSNVSKGNKQASNVSVLGVTEMTGSGTNVILSVIDLPLARRLAAPGDDSGDVSLKQTTASTGEKTQNVSTMTNGGSYQADSTPDTSTQESVKPLDPLNNQTAQVSDDVPNLDKNQEVHDSSKMLSTREEIENLIRRQLPDEQDNGESRTQ